MYVFVHRRQRNCNRYRYCHCYRYCAALWAALRERKTALDFFRSGLLLPPGGASFCRGGHCPPANKDTCLSKTCHAKERAKASPLQGGRWHSEAVTDEGAARSAPLTVRTACPPRPLIRPLRGHLPPGGWKACPAGDEGFFACKAPSKTALPTAPPARRWRRTTAPAG